MLTCGLEGTNGLRLSGCEIYVLVLKRGCNENNKCIHQRKEAH